MKKNLIIIILTLFAGIVQAQEKASAKVSVADFDDHPIVGAQVQFFDTKKIL